MQQASIRLRPQLAKRKAFIVILMVSLVATTLTSAALAHRVNIFAWLERDTVHVEGFFAGKKQARHALVEVFDSSGTLLLSGRTDDKGKFSFKIPQKTTLKIVLDAGLGHKNSFTLPESDMMEVANSADEVQQVLQTKADVAEPKMSAIAAGQAIVESNVDSNSHQLEVMIDQALDRKLAPVIELIRDSRQEGPRFTEVVGGLGYIFGLMGVALYFKNRTRE